MPAISRALPAIGVAAIGLAALIATGAPAPIVLAALVPGVLASGRPRPAFALQLALVVLWTAIGAGEPGVAALIAVLGGPLLIAAIDPEAIALPGLAPLLGLAGLGPVYPALAGLTRGAASRALLGGIGYLWIAAWEELAHRTLLLGPVADPPAGWKGSASTAFSDVLAPLIDGSVLAAAGIFAAAALVLPLLVLGAEAGRGEHEPSGPPLRGPAGRRRRRAAQPTDGRWSHAPFGIRRDRRRPPPALNGSRRRAPSHKPGFALGSNSERPCGRLAFRSGSA
jgi:hypothetical protein